MTTHKLYLRAPQKYHHTSTITALIDGDKPVVRLAETIFHPQGGGQKADRGTIGRMNVMHVAHGENGAVDHIVDSLADYQVGDSVELMIDQPFRQEQTRWHSAGHLLAHVAEELFPGLKAVAGHQWPGEARVDFTGTPPADADAVVWLQEAVNKAIADKVPAVMVGDPFAGRAVQIGNYPPVPCGGTHVIALADIGTVKIEKIKQEKDRIRIRYSVV